MVRTTIAAALLASAAALLAGGACTPRVEVCYSEGGMTRGEAKELAIYTERLFQPLPSGDVAAVEIGRGQIQAAQVSPCSGTDGYLARTPPDSVTSVTFDPPTLARFESSRFANDLILIDFTALEEGDGEIIVRAVFDGDEVEDRRPFRVRALADVSYEPVARGSTDVVGPLVAGAEIASFVWPATATGEPLVARTPAGWMRPDGRLELADYPWPSETDVAVKFPVAGMIPVRRGTESDWSYERTIDATTTIEVVPTSAIATSTFAEVSIPAIATSCGLDQGFIAEITMTDGGGRMIHGAAPLVVPSDPNALEIHLGEDPDEVFVRCKRAGDYRLDLPLPGAPKSLMVHIP